MPVRASVKYGAVLVVVAVAADALFGQAPTAPAGPPQGPPGVSPAAAAARPPAQQPPPSPVAVEKASQVLAATRQALGGEKLGAVKTMIVTGRTRRVRGNNLVPIEFEMFLELPDKFLRKDESPFEESDPTSVGFSGDELLQIPAPAASGALPAGVRMPAAGPAGRAMTPPTPEQLAAISRARVAAVKQDFVRTALGMFADSFATYPLTFAHIAVAEAPQGKADVLEARGANNFQLRFFINSQTRQPIMVSWTLPPTNVIVTAPGQAAPATVAPGAVVVVGPPLPAASASQAEKEAYAKEVAAVRQKAQATPVEHRVYYADYRDVNGVLLPFRFRRAIGADTTEETTVDRYRLNQKIPPERFVVAK